MVLQNLISSGGNEGNVSPSPGVIDTSVARLVNAPIHNISAQSEYLVTMSKQPITYSEQISGIFRGFYYSLSKYVGLITLQGLIFIGFGLFTWLGQRTRSSFFQSTSGPLSTFYVRSDRIYISK